MLEYLVMLAALTQNPSDIGVALCKGKEYESGYTLLNEIHLDNISDKQRGRYYFFKGLAAHQLGLKDEAQDCLHNFLTDAYVDSAPRRYVALAKLMEYDMKNWNKDKLYDLSRDMKGVARRLELMKGGPETRRQQKILLVKLDEMIKRKDNENKQQNKPEGKKGDANKGQCPPMPMSAQEPRAKAMTPMQDFQLPSGKNKGEIDSKKVKEYAEVWGKLPSKERAKAMTDLTRGLPAKYRDAIEKYFTELEKHK